jgi:hypothetical protein
MAGASFAWGLLRLVAAGMESGTLTATEVWRRWAENVRGFDIACSRGRAGGSWPGFDDGFRDWQPVNASTARHMINALEWRIFSRPTRESSRYRA